MGLLGTAYGAVVGVCAAPVILVFAMTVQNGFEVVIRDFSPSRTFYFCS